MRIAWLQFNIIWQESQRNLNLIESFVKNAHTDFDLLVLPEMFDTGFAMEPGKILNRNQEDVIQWIQQLAMDNQCSVMGSIIYKEDGKYSNRLIWSDGKVINYYDKIHLFGLGGESKNYKAGKDRILIHQSENVNIHPLVCYDLRFPEIARHKGNIQLITYVASWPESRIEHWSALLKARAIENQSFVLGVNRIGNDGNKLSYNGMSTLFSYDGTEILCSDDQEGIFVADIDIDALNNYREKLPFLKDQKI